MRWNTWYTAKSYYGSALWLAPLIALLLENIAIRLVFAGEQYLRWIPSFGFTQAGTAEALNTIETLSVSFIVFTFGSLLVATQIASGQLSPRIIATTLLRNDVIRVTVGLFTFTMMFAVGTGARLDTRVDHPAVAISWLLGTISIAAFLFLIDYTARLLRPISILWRVAEQGLSVIENVYPKAAEAPQVQNGLHLPGTPARTVLHEGRSGIVLAVNLEALLPLAQRAGGIIEFVPRVGDFVPVEEPLFRLYGGAARIDDKALRAYVALGPERTIEQDSTFAFRVIVDVGIKALSPAINDPTTAVLAIDQLQRLLRTVGLRHLRDDGLYDASGNLRVAFPTPNWQDFIQLAVSEIRLYGASNFQVARRLRAMIVSLLERLPETRHPDLHRQLDLLDRTLEKLHSLPEDLELAREMDYQGLGGSFPGARQ